MFSGNDLSSGKKIKKFQQQQKFWLTNSLDESGHLLIKLESQTEATSAFELKDPIESNEGVVLFKKNEKNLRNVFKLSAFL